MVSSEDGFNYTRYGFAWSVTNEFVSTPGRRGTEDSLSIIRNNSPPRPALQPLALAVIFSFLPRLFEGATNGERGAFQLVRTPSNLERTSEHQECMTFVVQFNVETVKTNSCFTAAEELETKDSPGLQGEK